MAIVKQRSAEQVLADELRAQRALIRRWEAARKERAAQVIRAGGTQEQVLRHCAEIDSTIAGERAYLATLSDQKGTRP